MQLIQLEAKRQSKDGFGGLILPASAKTTASSLYGVIASAAQDGAFWNTRESLSAICQWSRARLVSPWAVLGCTLARVVTATPPAIALPTGAG